MAPSPVIPTSFVPKQPVRSTGPFAKSGSNIFLIVGVILFALSLFLAGGVFAYEKYLEGVRDGKAADVAAAQEALDTEAVEEFVRTRDRFIAAKGLLDGHVAASKFFGLLENLTLENVRFDSLTYTLAEDRTAAITMGGSARTFNALAAQSSSFASEKRIKRAIFSEIDVADDGTVSFSLTAELAPSLLAYEADEVPPPAEAEVAPEAEESASETFLVPGETVIEPDTIAP